MTPGRCAIACALSICSSGVTHTGQPGPWTQLDLRGQQPIDPVLDDGVRLPPHTSIRVHGRVIDPPELRQRPWRRPARRGTRRGTSRLGLRRFAARPAETELLEQARRCARLPRDPTTLKREADVDEDVVAKPGLGHVRRGTPSRIVPAKSVRPMRETVVLEHLDDLTRDRQAHQSAPASAATRGLPERRALRRSWAPADACRPRSHRVLQPSLRSPAAATPVLEHTTTQRDARRGPVRPRIAQAYVARSPRPATHGSARRSSRRPAPPQADPRPPPRIDVRGADDELRHRSSQDAGRVDGGLCLGGCDASSSMAACASNVDACRADPSRLATASNRRARARRERRVQATRSAA